VLSKSRSATNETLIDPHSSSCSEIVVVSSSFSTSMEGRNAGLPATFSGQRFNVQRSIESG
jgi:hypothetical protein